MQIVTVFKQNQIQSGLTLNLQVVQRKNMEPIIYESIINVRMNPVQRLKHPQQVLDIQQFIQGLAQAGCGQYGIGTYCYGNPQEI
ncbi:UNKNOWN [Stylonychia lemnae]|uniref:Uncharacterized protein n=1 Tax=Stylonychia lemnae TaxID=5949 RepID=A0A078B4Z7_STYLE|nr:UNKNOWN [Stylonychia lemnae]|eukprot:CDW88302.1 UNKNOWN [Stylonychia lemnae]